MKFICSLVVVEDIQKSRKLYEDLLGQKVKSDYGENVTFEGDFAIHEKKHYQSLIPGHPVTKGGNSYELYFEEDDLPAVADKVKAHGLELLHDVLEQPWKQRVIRFYDYDKNIIEVGERLEHVAYRLYKEGESLEEISKITYLSQEIVKQAIEQYSSRA